MNGSLSSPAAGFAGQGLVCRRGGLPVFADLSFAVAPGTALVLTGPNGAGKSSLLRIMAGLLPPAAGTLSWNGETIESDDDDMRGRIRLAGHRDGLNAALTVHETLSVWAAVYGASAGEVDAAMVAFDLVRLSGTAIGLLSAGMRRRVVLARVTLGAGPLWLLDEPYTALDTANRARLTTAIVDHLGGGGLAVIASHDPVPIDAQIGLDLTAFAPAYPSDDEAPGKAMA